MAHKTPEVLQIEEAFSHIKNNHKGNNDMHLETIRRVTKRRYDLDIEIIVVENDMQFFGMTVYPEKDTVDLMVDAIVEKKSRLDTVQDIWAKNKTWVVEIDSKLLYDIRLNANPAEITAVYFHEIGHTVYANTIPKRVHKVLSYTAMHLPFSVKKIFTWSKARRLMGLGVLEACGRKVYYTREMRREVEADRFAIREGYGKNLSDFMTKLIESEGNRMFNLSEAELEKDIESVMQWVINTSSQLEFRRDYLKKSLNEQMLATTSAYARGFILRLRNLFFFDNERTRYDKLLKEQYMIEDYKKVVTEGFIRDWFDKGKVKKVDQSDIDIIGVEISRIQNEDDRIYVLYMIYDKLDHITLSLDYLKDEKRAKLVKVSKDTLLRQQDELNKYRKQVMDIRLAPKTVGMMIKYPPGYEG